MTEIILIESLTTDQEQLFTSLLLLSSPLEVFAGSTTGVAFSAKINGTDTDPGQSIGIIDVGDN